jgi:ribosomal protein S18 acetylase RimI-like enzyme
MTGAVWTPETEALLLGRMLEQLRRSVRTLADEVRPVGPGWVARTHALPTVWTLNQLRICEPVEFTAAVALADEHQGGLPYRHIVVDHDVAGQDLEAAFVADGWRAEREVLMALAERPDAPDVQNTISMLTETQALALTRRWMAEDHPGISADSLDQLDEYARREGRRWNERRFGILDDDGVAVAVTKLRTDPMTAWVEDVYTAPEARRRGYARLLVTHASALGAAANPELTFIVADDNDWPKDLYARIGFRPIARTRTFHRDDRPVD